MPEIPYEKMNIQWFPGHMTKAQRMIEENLKMVDAVCEILDARIPNASRNPDIDRLAAGKPRLVILNRTDLAQGHFIDPVWKTAQPLQRRVMENDIFPVCRSLDICLQRRRAEPDCQIHSFQGILRIQIPSQPVHDGFNVFCRRKQIIELDI